MLSEMVDPHMVGMRSRLMTVLQNALHRDTYVGLETMALVCETMAVDCRFDLWMFGVVKKNATGEQFMVLLEQYGSLSDECVNAVIKFHQDHDKPSFSNRS